MRFERFRVVCLCGSGQFKDVFERENERLTLGGYIVLAPGCFRFHRKNAEFVPVLGKTRKTMLDKMHLQKIDMADEVFVLNVGGYVGESTRREIEYAKKSGKPVLWLEPGHDEVAGGDS